MEHEFSGLIFVKLSHFKFHKNPSGGSGLVAHGETVRWTDRQT